MFCLNFSVLPILCANRCSCYYLQKERANVLNCSNASLTSLANLRVPDETTWLIADSNKIQSLCTTDNLGNISRLDLHSSEITFICDDYFHYLGSQGHLEYLNLANNTLTKFEKSIQTLTSLKTAFLAGNPIDCTCDTIWLADWLVNFTTPSGEKVVRDYQEVTCHGGEFNGSYVYKLKMRCDPVLSKLVGCYWRLRSCYLTFLKLWSKITFNFSIGHLSSWSC